MKKLIFVFMSCLSLLFVLTSCSNQNIETKPNEGDNNQTTPDNENNENDDNTNVDNDDEGNNDNDQVSNYTSTIYLAGDSTVKTYEDNQYIGGWGQYLDYFLGENITVKNAAQGGRSSRSFINEGRLYDIEDSKYNFTQNGGKSIGEVIQNGDYLFIQFGHNDDNTKVQSSYQTMYDRMVPLGTPDENGIYPVTPATKTSTTALPTEYTDVASSSEQTSALAEIAKYGSTYYAYNSGTYKWYLKQYIDFAREKGATPVLVTPVARVKFQNNEIVGGAGLHGENFAYVQAVRQLASEEDCLLIDLFAETKEILETLSSAYANYIMALKPNDLVGTWPQGYDNAYGNTFLGYTGIEATHYNKYGAFITAAKCAEAILSDSSKHNEDKEFYKFQSSVLNKPNKNVAPSNLISKTSVSAINNLFDKIDISNPDLVYNNPLDVVALIEAIEQKGSVTVDNYLEIQVLCENAKDAYIKLNVDDRPQVNNYSVLEAYIKDVDDIIISLRPVPTKVVTINASDLTVSTLETTTTYDEFKVVATKDKTVSIMNNSQTANYNNNQYEFANAFSMGGSASFGKHRYIEFVTNGKCTITVFAKSTGSDDRTLAMVNSDKQNITSFDALQSMSVTSYECENAGTYYLGSTNKGVYVYQILIEYFE